MRLDGDGIRLELPRGWEGGITRNPARTRSAAPDDPKGLQALDGATAARGTSVRVAADGSLEMPVTHLANFALPAALDVFGTQAVETMVVGDNFVSLVEYGPEEVDTPLFERRGLPRRLAVRDFSPKTLNRTLPDQVGTQVFATEADRAFCLYVVLAARQSIGRAVRDVNAVLTSLEVLPR